MTRRMRQLKIAKQVTNRDTPSLDKYLTEIGKVKLITAAEEVELAQRIKRGDHTALEALTKANLRFVVSVAKQYQGHGLTLPDLISEGNLGLIKAATRFDETRGFKFISYAVWWIRQQILQSLAEQARFVRLPLNRIGSINRIGKAIAKLEQENERTPNELELAEVLDMTVDDVRLLLLDARRHVSMDAPLPGSYSESSMHEVYKDPAAVSAEEILIDEDRKSTIISVLDTLPEREADVLIRFYGLKGKHPETYEEIGRKLGLTRRHVSLIRQRACSRLRKSGKRNKVLRHTSSN